MTFWEKRQLEKRCAPYQFSFLLQQKGSPHLGRKGSRSNNGIRKKFKKDVNETKDMIKTFTWRAVSCCEKRRQENENEMVLEISRHDEWLRHLVKFSSACALSFTFKSLSNCMYCSNSNLFLLYNETLRNWVIQQTSSCQLSKRTWGSLVLYQVLANFFGLLKRWLFRFRNLIIKGLKRKTEQSLGDVGF